MGKPGKLKRLDACLVESGLAGDLHQAASLILSGAVTLDGAKVNQAGAKVKEGQAVEVARKEHPYVGRGGLKLAAALDHFKISVEGALCLDVGSSTGGFTDCLLQRGAAQVWAVDVGRGQLDWKLRQDPRVVSMEQTHARDLKPGDFPEPFDFFCMDVSFISARSLLPALAPLLKGGGRWVVLVKPQFESKPQWVEKGGLVTRPDIQAQACREVALSASDVGLGPMEAIPSPLTGAQGNQEFLLAGEKKK